MRGLAPAALLRRATYGLTAAMIGLAGVLLAGPARASVSGPGAPGSSGCSVSFAPADAAPRWRSAAAAVQDKLRRDGGDCLSLTIEAEGDHALVVFVTRDGRQALRRVESPDELAPLIDALLVTIPPAAATADATAPVPSPATSATPAAERPSTPTAPAAASHVVLQANAGGRVSAPGGFASPSFGARIGAVVGGWDLAVGGQWDPAHVLMGGSAPQGFAMSRYAVGIAAGRRMPVGGASVGLALTTGVAVVSEMATSATDQTGGATAAEPLVGLGVSAAWPRRSPVRLRSELSGDAVASRIGRTYSIDPSLPDLPWWSAAATVGVEWEVP